jgi:hypothetical protein
MHEDVREPRKEAKYIKPLWHSKKLINNYDIL